MGAPRSTWHRRVRRRYKCAINAAAAADRLQYFSITNDIHDLIVEGAACAQHTYTSGSGGGGGVICMLSPFEAYRCTWRAHAPHFSNARSLICERANCLHRRRSTGPQFATTDKKLLALYHTKSHFLRCLYQLRNRTAQTDDSNNLIYISKVNHKYLNDC